MIPFVNLQAQYQQHAAEFEEAILAVLQDSMFIGGKKSGILRKHLPISMISITVFLVEMAAIAWRSCCVPGK